MKDSNMNKIELEIATYFKKSIGKSSRTIAYPTLSPSFEEFN
jgi:hypothetical protein